MNRATESHVKNSQEPCLAETELAGEGRCGGLRGRGGKGIESDLWPYPLSLGAGRNRTCSSPGAGDFAGTLLGLGMHNKHCFRKVSLAVVPDELMRERTKAKAWNHPLYSQPCAGGCKE